MSGISTICRFMIIVLIICAIVAPVFSSEPLNKGDAIILLIFTIPWAIEEIDLTTPALILGSYNAG